MGDAAKFDARFKSRLVRIVGASIAMGGVLLVAAMLMQPLLEMATVRYLALLALVLIGMISYFGIGHLLGAFRLSELKRNLRR